MGKRKGKKHRHWKIVLLAGMAVLGMTGCGKNKDAGENLIVTETRDDKIVNLFSPMEKTKPNAENVARNAFDKTIVMAEEKLGVKVAYITYTAERYLSAESGCGSGPRGRGKAAGSVGTGLCGKFKRNCENGKYGKRQACGDPTGGCCVWPVCKCGYV